MFGFKMPQNKAGSAFKSADMGGKLGMIGAALGGDFDVLAQMIGGQGQASTAPSGQMQLGGALDQVSMDVIGRLGEQSGLAPLRPRRFGFGGR